MTRRYVYSCCSVLAMAAAMTGCAGNTATTQKHYGLSQSLDVVVTSEAGARLASRPNVTFATRSAAPVEIEVFVQERRQTLLGVGTSFTESSAFVLAHLDQDKRREVMVKIYGQEGANFSIARTPIASTDFSVEGKYAYASVPGDTELKAFTIAPDTAGFSRAAYPGIVDESYDVLPMIQEALSIKAAQEQRDLRIIASAWTAPPWMKTIDDWYIRPTPANNYQGTGGDLKPEYVATYADYLIRYLDAYAERGVEIWGLTPVNEPHGNSGQWESMHFSPTSQADFVREHLGPRLQASNHSAINVLIYDQNRDGLEEWTDAFYADKAASEYVYGAAVHWYSSTTDVYEEVFERVKDFHPSFGLIHTEGTIDDLGKPAGGGIRDPENFTETNWFNNDAFWWNRNATDWAYSAEWAPNVEDHPIYTPVHRYARDIIVGFNHWLEGWVDWNIVLDQNGGPNHVGNFCGAPIMIDTRDQTVYYTPVYYVLAQLSRSIRPGDVAVRTTTTAASLDDDVLHASASINERGELSVQMLNTSKQPLELQLRIGAQAARVRLEANALQTIRVAL
ncbi:MAG: glycoside hydrolase family 30 beta sandwich domain-containing protein [Gammaproteobacteria bacterium]